MDRLLQGLSILAAAIIFGLMALTFVDVGGRYFFRSPVSGAFEITRLGLGTLVFVTLPVVCARDLHIKVDLLSGQLRGAVGAGFRVLASLLSATVLGFIAWRLWLQGGRLLEYGQTTQELELSLGPMAFLMSGLSGLSALVLILFIPAMWRGKGSVNDQPKEAV